MASILLVDDEDDFQRLISEWLKAENHDVETASDGEGALRRLLDGTFDLAILNCVLSGMTGVEVCKSYRAAGGETPILVLSSNKSADDRAIAFDAGVDDYVTKPFDFKELSARVRAWTRRSVRIARTPHRAKSDLQEISQPMEARPTESQNIDSEHEGSIFISYSSFDHDIAHDLCSALENEKMKCWIAPRDIPPGRKWPGEIIKGIRRSRMVVFVYSEPANNSDDIVRELEEAKSLHIPIIRFMLDKSEMSDDIRYLVKITQWFDASNGDAHEKIRELVAFMKQSRKETVRPSDRAKHSSEVSFPVDAAQSSASQSENGDFRTNTHNIENSLPKDIRALSNSKSAKNASRKNKKRETISAKQQPDTRKATEHNQAPMPSQQKEVAHNIPVTSSEGDVDHAVDVSAIDSKLSDKNSLRDNIEQSASSFIQTEQSDNGKAISTEKPDAGNHKSSWAGLPSITNDQADEGRRNSEQLSVLLRSGAAPVFYRKNEGLESRSICAVKVARNIPFIIDGMLTISTERSIAALSSDHLKLYPEAIFEEQFEDLVAKSLSNQRLILRQFSDSNNDQLAIRLKDGEPTQFWILPCQCPILQQGNVISCQSGAAIYRIGEELFVVEEREFSSLPKASITPAALEVSEQQATHMPRLLRERQDGQQSPNSQSGSNHSAVLLVCIALITIAGYFYSALTQRKSLVNWLPTENACILAESKHSPIFLLFETDWCPWCKKMDEVFYDKSVSSFLTHNLICTRAKVDDDRLARQFANKCSIEGYPSSVIYEPSTETFSVILGYQSPSAYMKQLKTALDQVKKGVPSRIQSADYSPAPAR